MNKLSLWELDDTTPIIFVVFGDVIEENVRSLGVLNRFIGIPIKHEYSVKVWEFKKNEMRKIMEKANEVNEK